MHFAFSCLFGDRSRTFQPRSFKGACSRDDPEDGARRGVPRRRLATAASGGREPPARALRPGREKLARRTGERSAVPPPKIATVRAPRGGRLPRDARRLARRLACRVMCRPTGLRGPVRLSALRHPFMGLREAKVAKPGRRKRAAGTIWAV